MLLSNVQIGRGTQRPVCLIIEGIQLKKNNYYREGGNENGEGVN